MKVQIIIILTILAFQVKSQSDTIMDIEILRIDTTHPLYGYFTFDSTVYPKQNLIVIKQIWVDKEDQNKIKLLQPGQKLTVELNLNRPEKDIWTMDSIEVRGHGRSTNSVYINAQLMRNENERKKIDFKPENAAIRMDYFELKRIKNGG